MILKDTMPINHFNNSFTEHNRKCSEFKTSLCACMCARACTYLHAADPALLEGAVLQVVGAHVTILAPVTWKHAAHTGSAPGW